MTEGRHELTRPEVLVCPLESELVECRIVSLALQACDTESAPEGIERCGGTPVEGRLNMVQSHV